VPTTARNLRRKKVPANIGSGELRRAARTGTSLPMPSRTSKLIRAMVGRSSAGPAILLPPAQKHLAEVMRARGEKPLAEYGTMT